MVIGIVAVNLLFIYLPFYEKGGVKFEDRMTCFNQNKPSSATRFVCINVYVH